MLRILIYLLLAVLLAPMPYGYYQLVRYVSMVVLTVMAFLLLNEKRKDGWYALVHWPLLFQPFIKIALERTI